MSRSEGLGTPGRTESKEKILYLCDGELERCNKRNCYKNNGCCNYTSDVRHAKNFHKINGSYPAFYENGAASGEPDTTMGLNIKKAKA